MWMRPTDDESTKLLARMHTETLRRDWGPSTARHVGTRPERPQRQHVPARTRPVRLLPH